MDLSIIIPTYNSESTIERALTSVRKINSIDCEIIVADDGSRDDTLDRIEKLNINNIQIIKFSHSGAGSIRNKAIMAARGKYLLFVDSDDELLVEANNLFNRHKSIIQSSYYDILNIDPRIPKDEVIKAEDYDKVVQLERSNLGLLSQEKTVWRSGPVSKLYKREFILGNNIKFAEDISVGEDLIFNNQCIKYFRKVLLINGKIYKINDNAESITHLILKQDFFEDNIKLIEELKDKVSFGFWREFIAKRYLMLYIQLVKSNLTSDKVCFYLKKFKSYYNLRLSSSRIFDLRNCLERTQFLVLLCIVCSPVIGKVFLPLFRRVIN